MPDEFGYLGLDAAEAKLMFQVFTEREGRKAVAVASNAPFSKAHIRTTQNWEPTIGAPAPRRSHRRSGRSVWSTVPTTACVLVLAGPPRPCFARRRIF